MPAFFGLPALLRTSNTYIHGMNSKTTPLLKPERVSIQKGGTTVVPRWSSESLEDSERESVGSLTMACYRAISQHQYRVTDVYIGLYLGLTTYIGLALNFSLRWNVLEVAKRTRQIQGQPHN